MAAIPNFDDKSLIDLIKNYPCLYFNLDKNFKKDDVKELCWTQIATELEYPDIYVIKRKWKMLRDKFIRRRKERIAARINQQDADPDWPLFEVFEKHFDRFIHLRSRKRTVKSHLKGDGKKSRNDEEEDSDDPGTTADEKNVEMILCDDGPQCQPINDSNRIGSASNSAFSDHSSESSSSLAPVLEQSIGIKIENPPDVMEQCIAFGERIQKLPSQSAYEAIRRMESILVELEMELK